MATPDPSLGAMSPVVSLFVLGDAFSATGMVTPSATSDGNCAAKNGEQVAVWDDREEPGSWILARVIKYVTETHHYEVSVCL